MKINESMRIASRKDANIHSAVHSINQSYIFQQLLMGKTYNKLNITLYPQRFHDYIKRKLAK